MWYLPGQIQAYCIQLVSCQESVPQVYRKEDVGSVQTETKLVKKQCSIKIPAYNTCTISQWILHALLISRHCWFPLTHHMTLPQAPLMFRGSPPSRRMSTDRHCEYGRKDWSTFLQVDTPPDDRNKFVGRRRGAMPPTPIWLHPFC